MAMPYLSRAADRPQITHGVQSGRLSGADGGVVWGRARTGPSQMMVEVATSESSSQCEGWLPRSAALPESDFTAKWLLENLPPGRIFSIASGSATLSHTRRFRASRSCGRFRNRAG